MSNNGGDKKPWDPEVEHIRKEARPSNLSEPLPRKKLPKDLQSALDDDETMWETLYEGKYVTSFHDPFYAQDLPFTAALIWKITYSSVMKLMESLADL